MVGKRRARKTRPPFKRYVGTGSIDGIAPEVSQEEESNEDSVQVVESNSSRLKLPYELIEMIVAKCPRRFPLLFINSQWYNATLSHMYSRPTLTSKNFAQFVEAITRDRRLGSFVTDLDLVDIAQMGKNSMTARLLRRCSPRLERFIAPQGHFGFSPVLALGSCHRLKVLDLRLVTEMVDLPKLLATISTFPFLEAMSFPRSSIRCDDCSKLKWPPNLKSLHLAGGISGDFLAVTNFPPTLRDLTMAHCPFVTTESLLIFLSRIGHQLRTLGLFYPMPLLSATALDTVLIMCPFVVSLRLSVDYASSRLLDVPDHPLRNLSIASSGMMGHANKLRPSDLLLATEHLTQLTRLSVSFQLGWNPQSDSLNALIEILNERGGGVWLE